MFVAGDLVSVQTSRSELNSRIWRVHGFTANGRVILASADGLTDDDGNTNKISVLEDNITHVAIVPFQDVSVSPPSNAQMTETVAVFTMFVHGTGGGQGPLLNQWIPLPLFGGNMIMLTESTDDHVGQLVMFPQCSGYQLVFYSTWANETIALEDCDVLEPCPQ